MVGGTWLEIFIYLYINFSQAKFRHAVVPSGVPEQVNVETTGHRSIVEKDVEGKDKELFENHVKHNEEKKMRVNA